MNTNMMLQIGAGVCFLAMLIASQSSIFAMLDRPAGSLPAGQEAALMQCEMALRQKPSDAPSRIKVASATAPVAVPACTNGKPFRVVIDLNAEATVMTPEDARIAGIDPDQLQYDIRIAIPGGTAEAATAVVPWLQVAGVLLKNVEVSVVRGGELALSILTPSALGTLSKFQVEDDELVLQH